MTKQARRAWLGICALSFAWSFGILAAVAAVAVVLLATG
jgi:hypothetical protein